jgi:hypothetical protein
MDPAHEELISLREAAKISGYSPDYIGQLIRSGKNHYQNSRRRKPAVSPKALEPVFNYS